VLQDAVNDGSFPTPRFPSGQKGKSPLNVNANQEDIDLLVAFDKGPVTHLVLVEAKGVTQFGNAQLISKGRRLKHIFGRAGDKYPSVSPHFLLASPARPKLHSTEYHQGLKTKGIPQWMLSDGDFIHIELLVPADRIVIERFDKESGKASKVGNQWRVKPAPVDRAPVIGPEEG